MTYIPDPIEMMDDRIERMVEDIRADGSWRCCSCRKWYHDCEPIPAEARPDAPMVCYDCLSPKDQKAWDEAMEGKK